MSRMPVVFAGHGSPMNAIEDNEYSRSWRDIASKIPKPEAIISISAHWYTKGTKIMNGEKTETIYDMYGFPRELYEIVYDAPGSPHVAKTAKELISKETEYDNSWGDRPWNMVNFGSHVSTKRCACLSNKYRCLCTP